MVDSDVCQRPVETFEAAIEFSHGSSSHQIPPQTTPRPSAGKRRGFDPSARHQVDRFRFPLRWGRYSQMR